MLGGVTFRRGETSVLSRPGYRMGALGAELCRGRKLTTTIRASPGQRGSALFAEFCPGPILVLTPGTLHPGPPVRPGRFERRRKIRALAVPWSTSLTWVGHFWKCDHSGRSHRSVASRLRLRGKGQPLEG